MTLLTRRYHFSASHRLHTDTLSPAENAALYGKCNNLYGHGHDYVLELTISGEPGPVTGLIVPLPQLDRFVNEKILRLFIHRNINLDVPQCAKLVPTTENIVLVIGALVEEEWPAFLPGSLSRPHKVHVQETGRNGFELLLGNARERLRLQLENESVMVNV